MRRTQKEGLFNLHVNDETETDSFEGPGYKGSCMCEKQTLRNHFKGISHYDVKYNYFCGF